MLLALSRGMQIFCMAKKQHCILVQKIESNVKRDKRNIELLKEQGWQVLTVWECELKKGKATETLKKLSALLILRWKLAIWFSHWHKSNRFQQTQYETVVWIREKRLRNAYYRFLYNSIPCIIPISLFRTPAYGDNFVLLQLTVFSCDDLMLSILIIAVNKNIQPWCKVSLFYRV